MTTDSELSKLLGAEPSRLQKILFAPFLQKIDIWSVVGVAVAIAATPVYSSPIQMGWAWLAWAIPAVMSALGMAQARQEGKKNRNEQQKLLDMQMQRQRELDKYGVPLVEKGTQNLDINQQYLRRLASGDRGLTQQTLAPEINQMSDMQRGSIAAQRGLVPRGGATAAAGAGLPQQLQANINNLLFSARPQAQAQLGQLGSNQTSLGLSAMGQGSGLTNSMLQYGLDARRLSMEQGQMFGQGIGNIAQLALQYYMNRPAATTATPPTYGGWAGNSNTSNFGMGQSPYATSGIYGIGNNSVSNTLGGKSSG